MIGSSSQTEELTAGKWVCVLTTRRVSEITILKISIPTDIIQSLKQTKLPT